MTKKNRLTYLVLAIILLMNACLPTEKPAQQPTEQPAIYTIFSKPPYSTILPDTTYSPQEIITHTVSISASPNEYAPLSLAIKAGQESLYNVSILSSDLTLGGSTIPKQNIDIRVVKVWKQAGLSAKLDSQEGNWIPELLLYNDADPLIGNLDANNMYTPPTISTELAANIPAQTTKQFWITIYIPPGTLPGNYSSMLSVLAENNPTREIQLSVTVLPITLHPPSQKYLIYYYYPYWIKTSEANLKTILYNQLMDIKNHGFQGMTAFLFNTDPNLFFETIKQVGLDGHIILQYVDQIPLLQSNGYTPYIYGIDEPYIYNAPNKTQSLRHQIRASYDIHQAGGLVVTAITKDISDLLRDPASLAYDQIDPATDITFREEGITQESVDWANYPADFLYNPKSFSDAYVLSLRNGGQKLPIIETYYWQCWLERPLFNRKLAGYFLWTSKLDGIMPYVYMHPPRLDGGNDPFNDFDAATGNPIRDMMTVYPSSEGSIPTIEWEGLREGYNDMRYLTTLFDLLNDLTRINPQLADSIKNEIDNDLLKYYYPSYNQDAAEQPSAVDFQNSRSLIISKILQIQEFTP